MVKQSTNNLSISIVSLVIIGVIIVLSVVGYFVYKNVSVKVDIEVKPSLNEVHQNYTVEIKTNAYLPSLLEINLGDSVTWINKDATLKHTITSNPPLQSQVLKLDDAFTFKFTESGTYNYHCLYHPEYGTIIVR